MSLHLVAAKLTLLTGLVDFPIFKQGVELLLKIFGFNDVYKKQSPSPRVGTVSMIDPI